MIKLGITGSNGFLGWHLMVHLRRHKNVVIRKLERPFWDRPDKLADFVKESDVIVHLAGLNRGDEYEIYNTNIDLTKKLIAACENTNSRPYIIFASSIHINRDTAYGRSKKESGVLLRKWASKNNSKISNLIIPNIFGEHGRPFYNSAVATFCYQISRGEKSEINRESSITFIHAQEVAGRIYRLIMEPQNEDIELPGREVNLLDLYKLLQSFRRDYLNNIMPDLSSDSKLSLFNTFRSYLIDLDSFYPRALAFPNVDHRGYLLEIIKQKTGGQVFLSTTKPGITRGNHYHTRKIERFCVVKGDAEIKMRKLLSDNTLSYKVTGEKPVYIDMPTFYTHNITNIGTSDLTTVFWISEIYDPKNPDTYQENV